MRSTMQDVPLTITTILRHACGVNADRTVTTAVGDGRYRTITYRELGEQVGRLANALRGLGITGDERVATFMWNNAEHLAAYLAAPSMGAVLHTLNIRLSPEQIAYIANEAEDQVIVADLSLVDQLAPVLPLLDTVHTVIAVGRGRSRTAGGLRQDRAALRRDAGRAVAGVRLARTGRDVGGRDVLHQRHHRKPERRCLQPSFELSARHEHLHRECAGHRHGRFGAAGRADVPRQCLGAAVRCADGRRRPGAVRPVPGCPIAHRPDRDAAADDRGCRADHLERRDALSGRVARP